MIAKENLDLPNGDDMRRCVIETDTALLPIAAGQHHLALLAGLPCSQLYLIADLCREMLARRHGACELVAVSDLDPDTVERIASAAGPVLLLAEGSDAALVEAARAAAFPIVVLNQRFSEASRDYMLARGISLQDTMRTMARAQIGIEALATIPRAIVLEPRRNEAAEVLVERIADVLALRSEEFLPMAADRQLARPLSALLDEVLPYHDVSLDIEADEMLGTLEAFYGFHPDGSAGTLRIPMAALLDAAPPHLPATNAIDLTGPPRCLTFGPYFHLPRGRWKAEFTFLSTGNVTTNTLAFDVAADHEIKVDQEFDLTSSGKFAFQCEFAIADPHAFLEFRTYLRRGSIEGQFRPLSLTLERCGASEVAN